MKIETINLVAGKQVDFSIAGAYFEIVSASAPLNVSFIGADAAKSADLDMTGASAGMFVREKYKGFSMLSSITQTVRVLIGPEIGGYRALVVNGVLDIKRYSPTNSFYSGVVSAGLVAEKILDFSTNPSGLILTSCGAEITSNNTSNLGAFISKAGNVAPASMTDGMMICSTTMSTFTMNGGSYITVCRLQERDLKIPAGHSLWWMVDYSISGGSMKKFASWVAL